MDLKKIRLLNNSRNGSNKKRQFLSKVPG